MTRKQEILKRKTEIRESLKNDNADIDALEIEVEKLQGELDVIEKREKLNDSLETRSVEKPQIQVIEKDLSRGGEVYRSAFMKNLMGKELNENEKRSIALTNVAGAIPTQTADEIVKKIREVAPLLQEITLLNVAGNVNFGVEGTNNDASLHTENASLTPQADTLTTVSLTGYEIAKLVRISKSVATMSISGFEDFLSGLLAENIATRIENYLVNGTGSSQPEGVDYAQTWVDATNAVDIADAGGAPTYAEIIEGIGYLAGGYYRRAKWLMNHKTYFTRIQALRDDGKYPIVGEIDGKHMIMGKPVLFSDYVNDDDMFIGDFSKIVANLSQDITVESSAHSGFAYNAVDYLGSAIFDSKVAVGTAFIKIAPTL